MPDSPGLRPSSDRVRETLFNWLGQDLAGWSPTYEAPVTLDRDGWTLAKAGPWSQGPALLQAIALLDDDALATGDLLHVLLERAGSMGVLGLDDLLQLPAGAAPVAPGAPPAGTAAALCCPANRIMRVQRQTILAGIAFQHGDIGRLVDDVETQAKAEAIRQCELVVRHIARVDSGVLLRHVAGNDVSAIGRYVQAGIGRTRLRAAFQHRTQQAWRLTGFGKAQIVDEEHSGPGPV